LDIGGYMNMPFMDFESIEDQWDIAAAKAEAKRSELVKNFINDFNSENERDLLDHLGDLAGGDAEFLHALQRGDATRMQTLFHNHIDFYLGRDLVNDEAELLMAES